MIDALEKLSRKTYYALVYPEALGYAALDRETSLPYKVDDISLAWLRREPHEFEDVCKKHPELTVVRISFSITLHEV